MMAEQAAPVAEGEEMVEYGEGMQPAGPLGLAALEVRLSPDSCPCARIHRAAGWDERPRHSRWFVRCSKVFPLTPVAQECGIAAGDLKKLLEAGVHTVEGLNAASKKMLKDIKGLSEQKVEKLKAAGAQPVPPFLLVSQLLPRIQLHTQFVKIRLKLLRSTCSLQACSCGFHDGNGGGSCSTGHDIPHNWLTEARRAPRR